MRLITKACDTVRNNKHFRTILSIILAFGNRMNAGTNKGQAYGFHIKALNLVCLFFISRHFFAFCHNIHS